MKKTFFLVALLSANIAAIAAEPTAAPTAPEWPAAQVVSIYSDTYTSVGMSIQDWGSGSVGSDFVISGNNTQKVVVGTNGVGYFGIQFPAAQNVLNMEKVHLDIYAEETISPNFYLISATTGEKGVAVPLTANTWNSVDLDLSAFSPVGMSDIHQMKFDGIPGKTIYLDNIYFYRTTPDTDSEAPTNVTATLKSVSYVSAVVTVSADDNSGSVSFDILNGTTKVGTGGGASGTALDIAVSGLAANSSYTLSVIAFDGNNNQAAPVSVEVNTLALPAAAPAPTALAADVLSLYSDAYTPATTFGIGWWGQMTVATEVELAANDHAYLCTNSNYLGWELGGTIDVTGFKGVHMDVYPVEGTSIKFTPIWGSELLVTKTLTVGQWNKVDFLLTEFTGLNPANVFQVKWADMPTTVLIDNVYFFKENTTGISEVESAAKVQKVIENGQLIIIKNGVRYDAMGAVIR